MEALQVTHRSGGVLRCLAARLPLEVGVAVGPDLLGK